MLKGSLRFCNNFIVSHFNNWQMISKIFMLLIIPAHLFAQKTIDVGKDNVNPIRDGLFYTVGGIPFSPYKYVKVVSASPYFQEEWLKGTAYLNDGHRSESRFKLDLLSQDVL